MSDSPTIIGLGEALWDVFPDSRRPGGAPANVAFQATQLGSRGQIASRIGDDDLGKELREVLGQSGVDLSLLQSDPHHPTGQVTVDMSDGGHPEYVIHEDVAWDYLQPTEELLHAAATAAAVCFGTLAQRTDVSRRTIHAVLEACSDDCLKVYDVNLRQKWYEADWIARSLAAADILKLNRDEANRLAPMLDLSGTDYVDFSRSALEKFDLDLVCITRAEDGCLLVSASEVADIPGSPVAVVDAVGSGDAFTAALITARLSDWPLEPTARFANAVGGLVASRPGAMPELTEELSRLRQAHAPAPA